MIGTLLRSSLSEKFSGFVGMVAEQITTEIIPPMMAQRFDPSLGNPEVPYDTNLPQHSFSFSWAGSPVGVILK